jgi:tetratricopeptide (TPR) repeat protein
MQKQTGLSTIYTLIIAALGVVVAAGVTSLVWWYFIGSQAPHKHRFDAAIQELSSTNEAYQQVGSKGVLSLNHATDTSSYIELYRQALTQATDPSQEGHLKYLIATAYVQNGEYIKAIPLFKEVAATKEYTKYDRALAVQAMGNTRFSFNDPSVDQVIFSDSPYSGMVVTNDYISTYIKLFQYSSSIAPVANSESRIAVLYAQEIDRSYASSHSTSTPEIAYMKDQLGRHVKNANTNIPILRQRRGSGGIISTSLLRIAVAYGHLAELGMYSPTDAEAAFNVVKAESIKTNFQIDVFWYCRYAMYLNEMYGPSRANDVRDLLSNIYNGGYSNTDQIMQFLAHEKNNNLGLKPSISKLASADPKFKQLLTSLGWTEADLK